MLQYRVMTTTIDMIDEAMAAMSRANEAFRADPTNHALRLAYLAAQDHVADLQRRRSKEQEPARADDLKQRRAMMRRIHRAE
jgi:hypothetical protein